MQTAGTHVGTARTHAFCSRSVLALSLTHAHISLAVLTLALVRVSGRGSAPGPVVVVLLTDAAVGSVRVVLTETDERLLQVLPRAGNALARVPVALASAITINKNT